MYPLEQNRIIDESSGVDNHSKIKSPIDHIIKKIDAVFKNIFGAISASSSKFMISLSSVIKGSKNDPTPEIKKMISDFVENENNGNPEAQVSSEKLKGGDPAPDLQKIIHDFVENKIPPNTHAQVSSVKVEEKPRKTVEKVLQEISQVVQENEKNQTIDSKSLESFIINLLDKNEIQWEHIASNPAILKELCSSEKTEEILVKIFPDKKNILIATGLFARRSSIVKIAQKNDEVKEKQGTAGNEPPAFRLINEITHLLNRMLNKKGLSLKDLEQDVEANALFQKSPVLVEVLKANRKILEAPEVKKTAVEQAAEIANVFYVTIGLKYQNLCRDGIKGAAIQILWTEINDQFAVAGVSWEDFKKDSIALQKWKSTTISKLVLEYHEKNNPETQRKYEVKALAKEHAASGGILAQLGLNREDADLANKARRIAFANHPDKTKNGDADLYEAATKLLNLKKQEDLEFYLDELDKERRALGFDL